MRVRFFTNRQGQTEAVVTSDGVYAVFVQIVDFELIELMIDGNEVDLQKACRYEDRINEATETLYSKLFNYRLSA